MEWLLDDAAFDVAQDGRAQSRADPQNRARQAAERLEDRETGVRSKVKRCREQRPTAARQRTPRPPSTMPATTSSRLT